MYPLDSNKAHRQPSESHPIALHCMQIKMEFMLNLIHILNALDVCAKSNTRILEN